MLAVRGCRTLTGRSVPARADGCPDERTATLATVEGRFGGGEVLVQARIDLCRPRRDGGIDVDGRSTATVTTAGSPEVTDWLFFGWANA
ncbi:hypothetical protein ACFFSW_17830 [Saccharothrix longispora]|uniref:Uncharacterized protein n=1 Tax=Saccharothrix longispora TaxID=33920 RepID=A0ABU1PTH0_9PSEU|nr:hypothetical protein [Saccharothrix longispora]MDR6593563.1 hypothetical protein [Saccharothrix longispora]